MELKNLIQEGAKGLVGAVTEHHSGIFTVTTICAIGAFGVEVWMQKDAIVTAYEETKGQPFMAKVKAMWKPVAKCAVPFGIAVSSQLANHVMSVKQLKEATDKLQDVAALANTTVIAANAYEEATKETVGEEKAKEIKEKAVEKQVVANQSPSAIVLNGRYDIYVDGSNPGIEFLFNEDKCDLLEKEINQRMDEKANAAFDEDKVIDLTEVYDIIGDMINQDIPETTVSGKLGWCVNDGDIIRINTQPSVTKDGRPCMKIIYYPEPTFIGTNKNGFRGY